MCKRRSLTKDPNLPLQFRDSGPYYPIIYKHFSYKVKRVFIFIRSISKKSSTVREQPPHTCKHVSSKITCESAIGHHLITNPECAKTCTDDSFRIIRQARLSFYLSVWESVYIKTQISILCRQRLRFHGTLERFCMEPFGPGTNRILVYTMPWNRSVQNRSFQSIHA